MNKAIYILLIIAGVLGSCTYEHRAADPKLPDTVSFKQHIVPLFVNNCNDVGCHSGSSPAAKVNFEPQKAYQQLFDKSMIDTIQPSHSLLYFQMTSTNSPMPPSGNLDSMSLKLVLKWIQQGAKNN